MPLVIVAIGVILLLLLMIRFKMNGFIALVLVALAVGLMQGMPLDKVIGSIKAGVGGTLGSLALIMGFGAMLGKMLADCGGAQRIATTLIAKFGKKHIQWAVVLTGFTVGFALFYEHDAAAPEEDCSLNLGTLLEELLGVLELELKVVLVGIGPEADFLDDHLGGVGLHLLGPLLLLVAVLLVIQNLADWGIGLGAYLHQIKLHFVRHCESLRDRIDARFGDVVSYETHLYGMNLIVDRKFVLVFLLVQTGVLLASARFVGGLRSVRSWH